MDVLVVVVPISWSSADEEILLFFVGGAISVRYLRVSRVVCNRYKGFDIAIEQIRIEEQSRGDAASQ